MGKAGSQIKQNSRMSRARNWLHFHIYMYKHKIVFDINQSFNLASNVIQTLDKLVSLNCCNIWTAWSELWISGNDCSGWVETSTGQSKFIPTDPSLLGHTYQTVSLFTLISAKFLYRNQGFLEGFLEIPERNKTVLGNLIVIGRPIIFLTRSKTEEDYVIPGFPHPSWHRRHSTIIFHISWQ